jgi:hypothetical protein
MTRSMGLKPSQDPVVIRIAALRHCGIADCALTSTSAWG